MRIIGGKTESIDGYKLCKLTRRPFPRQADDVGTWQLAMEVMGWAVLVTNLAIICFSASDLDFNFLGLSDSYFEETLTALIVFVILFLLISILNFFIGAKPRKIKEHNERQNHIEDEVVQIGKNIDRYLETMNLNHLKNWKNWKPQQIANYLKEICYKNPEMFRTLSASIRQSRFDGKAFEECDEHLLEKRLDITDHLHKRFILNARRVLEEQIIRAEKEAQLFESESAYGGYGGVGGEEMKSEYSSDFTFSNDHLIQMAEFFEEDLTGQSKRKLWTKVDKDMSSLIEKNEMENFLYFSIVVYIKAKYSNVRLPKKTDKKFQKNILKPLEKWLLHYKISVHGLTFDEFDRFFPSWLREYYREHTAQRQGQTAISMLANDDSVIGQSDTDHHLQAKLLRNKAKKAKLGSLLGTGGGMFHGKKERESGSDTGGDEEQRRKGWNKECIEWERKLFDVAHAIDKTDQSTREKIWYKFDRKKS